MSDESRLIETFDREGREEIVGGNTPFLLEGADNVWLVRSGKVEIFSVGVEDAKPHGTRHHFLTAEAGDLLFGMDLDGYGEGLGLLAVGVVGTRLLRMSVGRLRESSPEGLSPAMDRWILGLSEGVSRTIIPQPRADLALKAGEQGELGDGKRARSRKGVVWIRHEEGTTLFIGMEESGDETALFPITGASFLQALGPVRLAAVSTDEALGRPEGWGGLQALYGAIFRCEFFNTRLAAADELNRLREKAERDERVRGTALNQLASVLAERPSPLLELEGDDPLLAAVYVLGQHLGLAVKAAPKLREGETYADPLGEICRASRIRSRKVVLKGEWWAIETTPLLCFLEEDKRPLAIIPTGPGRYEVHDPTAGIVKPLSEELARGIGPKAHTFYRSFPDGAMDALKVFKFGLAGNKGDLARPLAVGFIAGLLGLLTPQITGRIVDKVIPEASRSRLLQLVMILAAVTIAQFLLDIVRRLGVLRLEIKMSGDSQPAMWDRLINLPSAFFRKYVSGDLSVRVNSIDRIRQTLSATTSTTLMLSLFSVLYLIQCFYYSWRLALLALGFVLLPLIAMSIAASMKLGIQREVADVEGKISGLVLQLLTGVSKLRVTGAEGRAFSQWARLFGRQKKLALRGSMIDAGINVFNSAFPVISAMGLFKLMQHLTQKAIEDGKTPLSIGDFVAFNAAFVILLNQTLQLALAVMLALEIVPLFDRARPILEADPEVDPSKADPGELGGEIEISRVSFRYHSDGPLILDDVSIHIPSGKFVAFVGPSGSGKSTLLRMLLGLDVPETGAIYYDGRDLAQLDAQRLRRKIGVVIQQGKIRQGSIFENIVGSQPYTLEEAWEAAQMAGFDEDVRNMPMGMHTVLQQGGGALSGGQRQRLMIARAIVSRPRVLFFDEATSALDNRTQAIVSESLQKLQSTRVAIAHRLSTIMGADQINVIVAGRVVQSGTYQELMAQEGVFAELVKRQVA